MTSKTKQTAAQAMLNAFQAQGAIVEESTFFGVPVRAYFGEPIVSQDPVVAPAGTWQINRTASVQMMAEFAAMGAQQIDPTFFGVPIAEYFGKDIWRKILDDVMTHAPMPNPAGA
jgi:hypothetical protein